MAYTDIADALKVWTQSSATAERKRQKQLLKGIDELNYRETDILSKIKRGPEWGGPVKWFTERYWYEPKVTALWDGSTDLTISGTLLGAAVTADSIKSHIRVNTVVERVSDGVQLLVSAVNYTTKVATVATHGNTSGSADSAAVEYEVLAPMDSDYHTDHQPKSLDTTQRSVGTQIFTETFEWPHSWAHTDFENIKDNVSDQVEKIVWDMRNKLAKAVIRGRPVYDSGWVWGDEQQKSSMGGLYWWAEYMNSLSAKTNTYVNVTDPLSPDIIDKLWFYLKKEEWANDKKGKWIILCDKSQAYHISEFEEERREMGYDRKEVGYQVTKFRTKDGKVLPVVIDDHCRPGVLNIVDTTSLEWGYYKGDKPWTKELATQNRTNRRLITFQAGGLIARRPRQIGMIYGLPEYFA
jgi:hypothetical protein